MKIKRILAVMLAGAMMLSMAACGGESKEDSAAQPSAEQKTIDGNVLDAEQYFNGYLGADPTTLDGVIGNDNIGGGVLNNVMEPLTRLAEKDGKNIHIIGDAARVGNLMNAIWQAYDVARAI